MSLSAAILAVLVSLAPHRTDVALTLDERTALLLPVAEAYAAAARTRQEAAFLIAQGEHESHYSSAVLRGACHELGRHACDPDRNGVPRAVGPLQAWPLHCRTADTLAGQAQCVLRNARGGLARCTTWEGAFLAQSGRYGCKARWAERRVETMRKALYRLNTEIWKAEQAIAGFKVGRAGSASRISEETP